MLTIWSTYENTWCCSRVFFIAGSTGTLISSRAFNIWDKNADKLELRKKAWSSYSCKKKKKKKKKLENEFFPFKKIVPVELQQLWLNPWQSFRADDHGQPDKQKVEICHLCQVLSKLFLFELSTGYTSWKLKKKIYDYASKKCQTYFTS